MVITHITLNQHIKAATINKQAIKHTKLLNKNFKVNQHTKPVTITYYINLLVSNQILGLLIKLEPGTGP